MSGHKKSVRQVELRFRHAILAGAQGVREIRSRANNMMNRRHFCALTSSALPALRSQGVLGAILGQDSNLLLSGSDNEFVLKAPLGNPYYVWPRTLLAYPLDSRAQISADSHRLRCVETREVMPFQVSKHDVPELLFFSDLPAGETRTYRLEPSSSGQPNPVQNRVIVTREENFLTINPGPIQARIPASQVVTGEAPGPILEISRGGKWTGQSKFAVHDHAVVSIQTEELEAGPLRSTHRITYMLADGAKYMATVQCSAGLDFLRLHENMELLTADAQGEFEFAWTGCKFEYRQMPNHPYNFPQAPLPSYASYPWEAIAPALMDNQFGVVPGVDATGKMPVNLKTYEPWIDHASASFANFWGDSSPDAAAIFIDRMEQWEDHEYAIWRSSPRLAVDFVYRNSTLHFIWKIAKGTRSSCVAFYDHANDIDAMKRLEQGFNGIETSDGHFRTSIFPCSYALELQNWYGTFNLDKTKGWQLTYPEHARLPKQLFREVEYKNADDFYRKVAGSEFQTQLALTGTRQVHGPANGAIGGPVATRQILESWIPGYQMFRAQLDQSQRRRIEAILLLIAYVHSGEDYMPLQRMLSGHPNFLSDVKSTPPGMSFLFPDHPDADAWADEWEAFLRLNTRYHTRPAVEAWNTRGGRWTENLGTYVWAFLRPASRAAFLLKSRDGIQRLCTPQLVSMADWLVNALSAPFAGESPDMMKQIAANKSHYWDMVSPADGPRRVYPPIGAHADRRTTPAAMWYLGTALRNYSPLIAEHLMWASRPTDMDMEAPVDRPNPWKVMVDQPDNRGTNPHLRSAKYTGFGITLRAAVDSPKELSIHLIQIDDGPNYRWGHPGEGSCGVLYFFANGKGYSHNGFEDDGDRIDQDTDFCTNFGVWKGTSYHAIGQNVLSRPLYDLVYAQFAEITARQGANAYSWPEYVGRSITLAGDDYFLIYDQVFNPEVAHRFSWFVRKGDDFPHISLLKGPTHNFEQLTSVETEHTNGKWADGMGDCLALITHKEGIQAKAAPFGCRVNAPGGSDLVFANQETVQFQEGNNAFTGTSGIIRDRGDGFEIALFHGTHIAASGFRFTTRDTNLGISAKFAKSANNGQAEGYFFAPAASEIVIGLPPHADKAALYVNGNHAGSSQDDQITVTLPAGEHRWELTAGLPVPLAPSIEYTEYSADGATVYGIPVAAATSYQLEISADNAVTWQPAGVASSTPVIRLTGLVNGKKYHTRMIAKNEEHISPAGPEYPLYITQDPPPPPDGVHVELSNGLATLTWGEVLGVTQYRVYRRKKGEAQFAVAYAGRATIWQDTDSSILPPASSPKNSASRSNAPQAAVEYYITASNHNGEGSRTRISNTDPASWRNWNPTDGEPFRRTQWLTEGNLPNDGGDRHYPK